MSTRPNSFRTRSRRASTERRSVTSTKHSGARLPAGTVCAPCCARPAAMAFPIPEVPPMITATRSVRSKQDGMSVRNFHDPIVLRVGPPFIGKNRRPAGTAGIPIIRISAEPLVQFAVLAEFVAIEPHAQTRSVRHTDGAVLVLHRAAFDDVVGKAVSYTHLRAH